MDDSRRTDEHQARRVANARVATSSRSSLREFSYIRASASTLGAQRLFRLKHQPDPYGSIVRTMPGSRSATRASRVQGTDNETLPAIVAVASLIGMAASPRLSPNRKESNGRDPTQRDFQSGQTRAHHEHHNPLIGASRDADATVGSRRARRIIGNATPPVIKGMWPSLVRT